MNIVNIRTAIKDLPLFWFAGTAAELIYREEFFYFIFENFMYRIDELGSMVRFELDSKINCFTAQEHHTALRFIAATELGSVILRADSKDVKANSHYFAEDAKPIAVKYIPDNKVLVIESDKVAVFDIRNDLPVTLGIIEIEEEALSIVAVKRDTFAILFRSGRMTLHQIESL